MSEHYAVVVGIERYRETGLENVAYATRDAAEIAKALEQIGYERRNIALMCDDAATAIAIDYECRLMAKNGQKGDELTFFFAGHGYTVGGRNYLLAHDTKRGDIAGTSVPLQRLLEYFAESPAKHIACFLDCCHSGMNLGDEERGVIEQMSEGELKEFFQKAEYRVVFSACSSDEKSYPSLKYKHGYWTFHLLRALSGDEPHLLDKSGRLLSTELQDYLRSEVPKQVRIQRTDRRSQNPKMYGDVSGTFVVADLKRLLEKKHAELQLRQSGFKDFSFKGGESGGVDELSGFVKAKGHRPPKFVSRTSQKWVVDLAQGDIEKELMNIFKGIQKSGSYKNREIKYDPPAEGSGSVRTPDFQFVISYEQNEHNPGMYDMTRELNRLSNPDLISKGWFNQVFGALFDEAVLEFTAPLDVNAFIDKVEDADAISVDYDPERTRCELTVKGFDGAIIATASSLTYDFERTLPIGEMTARIREARALLAGVPTVSAMLPLS